MSEVQNLQVAIPAFEQAVIASKTAKKLAKSLEKATGRMERLMIVLDEDSAGIDLEEAVKRNQEAKRLLAQQMEVETKMIVEMARVQEGKNKKQA